VRTVWQLLGHNHQALLTLESDDTALIAAIESAVREAGLLLSVERTSRPIEELPLDARAYNSLRRAGIEKIGDLVGLSRPELLSIVDGLGEKLLAEVENALASAGLALREP
jgi:DNA-directed RNA polymerase subunit alpha